MSMMADRILCSCITCPKCGTWIVLRSESDTNAKQAKTKTLCSAPDCGKEFAFAWDEARILDLPLGLFERRYFYRSELQQTGT